MRSILAAFKAPTYNLAKFIISFLEPLTTNEFTLRNSYDFKNVLSSLSFPLGSVMTSFDVTSLFTNVPIEETINIVMDSLFNNINEIRGISNIDFRKLLRLCIKDNHFIFNKDHYAQHEGFAMGSPLSAPMANIFLCHYEKKWLDECPDDFKPLLYKRYVDDTFLIFKQNEHVRQFLDYLNSKHPNINFTSECETANKLSFLDIDITKNFNASVSFVFSIFRKKTFTGLGMNYHSHTSYIYKLNNIRTLLNRAYILCSCWISLHKEFDFLINFFKANGYPQSTVFRIIYKFMNTKCNEDTESIISKANKLVIYHKFPYINDLSSNFVKKEMKRLMDKFYPHIDFRPVFFNNFSIKGLLNHKEKLPDGLCSGVCYNYTCGACSATYIGSTIKCLKTRADEHFGRSSRTGNLLARPLQSKVREHIFNCNSVLSLDDFKILSSFNDHVQLRIAESLEIHFRKPSINGDSSSFPLLLV